MGIATPIWGYWQFIVLILRRSYEGAHRGNSWHARERSDATSRGFVALGAVPPLGSSLGYLLMNILFDAFDSIYEAALDPHHWPRALQAIADCFGDIGTVLMFGRDDGSMGTIVSASLTAAQEDYDSHWHLHDLRVARAVERGLLLKSDAITDRHVVSKEETESHPIYTDFLAKHGLGWCAAITVLPHPRNPVFISVQRPKSKPPYSEDELEILVRIGRHLENALRVGIRLLQAESRNKSLIELFSALDYGVLILDARHDVVFKNALAQRALLNGFSLRPLLAGNRTFAEIECTTRALLAGEMPDAHRPIGPIRIDRPNDRPFLVYVMPIAVGGGDSVLSMFDSAMSIGPNPALLRDALGLTLSEAKVAALVGAGTAPQKAADQLGLAEDTVRKTLKTIFSKVGVTRQSELVALLARMHLN
jgi:DNA-binding CsgD family transcriptional regulator